jgi:hypothetical protein
VKLIVTIASIIGGGKRDTSRSSSLVDASYGGDGCSSWLIDCCRSFTVVLAAVILAVSVAHVMYTMVVLAGSVYLDISVFVASVALAQTIIILVLTPDIAFSVISLLHC